MALTKISRSLLDTGISDSSDATAITIDSSENVGLGARLSVGTTTVGGGNTKIVATGGSDNYLQLVSSTGTGGVSLGNAGSTFLIYTHTGALGSESFSERMRIDSSGNVGVGTTDTNSHRMAIDSGAGTSLGLMHKSSNAFTLMTFKASGTSQDIRLGAVGNDMLFQTNGTERMRIESDGGVAIGDTTCVYTLEVHGTTIFRGATYTGGSAMPLADNTYDLGHSSYRWDDVYATNATIQTSDQNKKNTITNSDLGLDFINRLSPKSYKLNGGTRTHYGLIAQDVETVLSDISKPTADFAGFIKMIPEEEAPKHEENPNTETTYGLRYGEFIAPLIKAIQEQQAQIEALQSEINTLKGE